MYQHGLVIGKFMPPHIGHLALIRFAKMQAKQLTVLVEQRPDEPIDVHLRTQWLQEALHDSSITFKVLLGDHPQSPPLEHPEFFWAYWAKLLRQHCPSMDVLISSESYGHTLAKDQEIPWIPFDRDILRTSGTHVRMHPTTAWWDLIEPARRDLIKRVVIVGPESTGKSTLAQAIATEHHTLCIPEYAARWISEHPQSTIDESVLRLFAKAQQDMQQVMACQAARWMIEDSHPLTTSVWARYLGFTSLAEELHQKCREHTAPDLILLTHPEALPWIEDVHRPQPTDRIWFLQQFIAQLHDLKWHFHLLRGNMDTQKEEALTLVNMRVASWSQSLSL